MTFELPKGQRLHMQGRRDCGLRVFAELTHVPAEDIRRDLPMAFSGEVSVDGWLEWLKSMDFVPVKRDGCPDDILPCAHLVGPALCRDERDFHWVYRDECGDVHDPSLAYAICGANLPFMRELQGRTKVLTITIQSRPQADKS